MTPSNNRVATESLSITFNKKMVKVGGQVGCVTLLIVIAAYLGGVLLDRYLGTHHTLLIIFLIGAGPLATFVSYRLALRAVRDVRPVIQASKEERTGD
jgi:hypothetical protein